MAFHIFLVLLIIKLLVAGIQPRALYGTTDIEVKWIIFPMELLKNLYNFNNIIFEYWASCQGWTGSSGSVVFFSHDHCLHQLCFETGLNTREARGRISISGDWGSESSPWALIQLPLYSWKLVYSGLLLLVGYMD